MYMSDQTIDISLPWGSSKRSITQWWCVCILAGLLNSGHPISSGVVVFCHLAGSTSFKELKRLAASRAWQCSWGCTACPSNVSSMPNSHTCRVISFSSPLRDAAGQAGKLFVFLSDPTQAEPEHGVYHQLVPMLGGGRALHVGERALIPYFSQPCICKRSSIAFYHLWFRWKGPHPGDGKKERRRSWESFASFIDAHGVIFHCSLRLVNVGSQNQQWPYALRGCQTSCSSWPIAVVSCPFWKIPNQRRRPAQAVSLWGVLILFEHPYPDAPTFADV